MARKGERSEMYSRDGPSRESLSDLKKTILGYCAPLKPPRVFVPSNVRNPFVLGTETHERCHAVLVCSTNYGRCEQILAWLSRARCPHVGRELVESAIEQCVANSFNVHEGAATLSELVLLEELAPSRVQQFRRRLPPDYRRALSQVSEAVGLFGFEGYVRAWLGLELAAVCLSPPLFGPLAHYTHYVDGTIPGIFDLEAFSADARLTTLISELRSGRLRDVVDEVRMVVREAIREVFPEAPDADFWHDGRRKQFVRICESQVERCIATSHPEIYMTQHDLMAEWPRIWRDIVAGFEAAGCCCLSDCRFAVSDLLEDTEMVCPVGVLQREGHPGAIELAQVSQLPIDHGERYYVALAPWEESKPFRICDDPLRQLHKGHVYMRLHEYKFSKDALACADHYWFKIVTSDEIRETLTWLANIPGIAVVTACGPGAMTWMQHWRTYLPDKRYLLIGGLSARDLVSVVESLPAPRYQPFTIFSREAGDVMLFLRDPDGGFAAIAPMTLSTLGALAQTHEGVAKLELRVAEPETSDRLCFRHLREFGW